MVEEYQLSTVKIADLKLDPSNPNKPTKEQIAGIRQSIKEFGFVKPLVINENMEIADGEHRALVMKALGKTEIQAYIVPRINDDIKRRLARQTLNKLQGEHDIKLDADEMALIFQAGKLDNLAELIAKDQRELKRAITAGRPDLQFEVAESTEELEQLIDEQMKRQAPDTQLGDIYQLGRHRIICADASDEQSIKRLLEDRKADMVFTDPPYYILGSSTGFTNQHGDDAMVTPFFRNVMLVVAQNLKFNNHVYICCNWRSFPTYYELTKEKHYSLTPRNLIVWSKPNMRLGGYYSSSHEFIYFLEKSMRDIGLSLSAADVGRESRRVNGDTNVWIINTITDLKQKEHGAQKPIELVQRAVNNSSDEGDLIFDPFLGSGSTLIACEQTNRICYGVEIDPHYCDVVIKRWEQFTGQKAAKLQ